MLVDVDRIDAIPTRYAGVQFRSLLEAKWACVFDLLKLQWDYEPMELGGDPPGTGFIPDFIVDVALSAGPGRVPVSPLLVEVKPNVVAEDYRESINKIARSGWRGGAMVLGCVVREAEMFADEPEFWCGFAHPQVRPFHAEPVSHEWFRVGFEKPEGSKGYFAFGGNYNLVRLWREAGNVLQWKTPR